MKNKIIRFKDKIHAILTILWCNEFVLFTCQKFNKTDDAVCIFSNGVENKEESKIFRETISEYIMNFN